MKTRVDRLTEVVRAYDPLLYVVKTINGMMQVHRKVDRLQATGGGEWEVHPGYLGSRFVLALTDTWLLTGKPVDWGIEPVMQTLRGMDQWSHDDFEDMVERRERNEQDKHRALQNDLRARAADMRHDFARATNDINTSTIAKVDLRRKKDGYC